MCGSMPCRTGIPHLPVYPTKGSSQLTDERDRGRPDDPGRPDDRPPPEKPPGPPFDPPGPPPDRPPKPPKPPKDREVG